MNYAIKMLKSDLLEQIAERSGIMEILNDVDEDEQSDFHDHLKIINRNIKDIQDVLKCSSENPDSISSGNSVKRIV